MFFSFVSEEGGIFAVLKEKVHEKVFPNLPYKNKGLSEVLRSKKKGAKGVTVPAPKAPEWRRGIMDVEQ